MTIIHTINGAKLPEYQTAGAVGFDIESNSEVDLPIFPGKTVLVPTGLVLRLDMSANIELQIRSRSSLCLKKGLIVLNAPGTIDPDYEGEIQVMLHNVSGSVQVVRRGDRIAQGVFARFIRSPGLMVAGQIRGDGGFGSTGLN